MEFLAEKCAPQAVTSELAYDAVAAMVQQTPSVHFLADIVPQRKTPAEIVASMQKVPAHSSPGMTLFVIRRHCGSCFTYVQCCYSNHHSSLP